MLTTFKIYGMTPSFKTYVTRKIEELTKDWKPVENKGVGWQHKGSQKVREVHRELVHDFTKVIETEHNEEPKEELYEIAFRALDDYSRKWL